MFYKTLSFLTLLLIVVLHFFLSGCDFKPDITIIYSNDILGELENCGCDKRQLGSLSRKAAVIDALKKTNENILNLDAGNLFFSKKPLNILEKNEFLLKSEYILKAYDLIAPDALNIGRNDLIFGTAPLLRMKHKASFPFISSNIVNKKTGIPVFEPFVIKEVHRTKIGIIGLCGELPAVSSLIRIEDPVKTAEKWLGILADKCEYIILLSDLGLENDKKLASKLNGISLIISAKSENRLTRPVLIQKTWITQTDKRGQHLGEIKIYFKKESKIKIKSRRIPLDNRTGENKIIKTIEKEYKSALKAMNKQEFFKAALKEKDGEEPENLHYIGAEKCGECHIPQYENWENTFHAEAYAALEREEDNYAMECLHCHTVGYGEPGGFDVSQGTGSRFLNVQCESCHGPGSHHSGKSGILRNTGQKGCRTCHDPKNSPAFDYEKYLPLVKCPSGM